MKTLKDRIIDLRNKGYPYDTAVDLAYKNAMNIEYDRRMRLDRRIKAMIETENAIFYTLTFTDDSLKKYTDDQLYNKAKKWSQKHLRLYLGNRDEGSENGRVHYHVIGVPMDKPPSHKTWQYGALNFIRSYNTNHKKIRNYILKLRQHAEKKTSSKLFKSQKIR